MNQQETYAKFRQAVKEFNQKEFYACHDTLEALWMESSEPNKTFYQGILQISVACYHLSNQNWRGAVILLAEGQKKLKGYKPSYYGIDVDHLYQQSNFLLQSLYRVEPTQIEELLLEIEANQRDGWPSILFV